MNDVPGISVTAPWALERKYYFLISAHGVLRRMGAVSEIPGTYQIEYLCIFYIFLSADTECPSVRFLLLRDHVI